MSDYILTPVGRMIQGNLFEGSDTDFYGKPRTDRDGNPTIQWYVGLAIPKIDATGQPNQEWAAFWATLQAEAQAGFPRGEYQWNGFHPDGVTPDPTKVFAWKVEDGDGPKFQGKEGAAGCWIVKATTGFAPSVFNVENQQLLDPKQAARGHFYQLAVTFKGNGDTVKPGMYINLVMARLVGYGQEIIGGPDAATVFGAAPAQLPNGASAQPLAPANTMPAMGHQPGNAMIPGNTMLPGNTMVQTNAPANNMQMAPTPNMAPGHNPNMAPAHNPNMAPAHNPNMAPAHNMQQIPANTMDMAPNANAGQPVVYDANGQIVAPGNPTAMMSPGNQMQPNQVIPHTDFLQQRPQ